MLEYPTWFSAFDRARIEAVLETCETPLETTATQGCSPDLVIFRRGYASEAEIVQAVVAVCTVMAQALRRHDDRSPLEQHRVDPKCDHSWER